MRKISLLLAFAAFACAHSSSSGPKPLADIELIEHVREDWVSDWNAKRLDDIIKLYEPDAVFLRPTAPRTTGTPAIRELFENVLATNTPHIAFHGITLEGSGNLAYDSGTYDETITTPHGVVTAHGDYLLVFKRQSDGRWRIAAQAWSDASNAERSMSR